MKVWTALVVDDEFLARQELIKLLKDHPQVEVKGESAFMTDAIEAIQVLSPDVVFLDIDLGRYTGFDLLERVPPIFKIIFVTAYDEYAIRAFQVNALDYLLKPIHPERLRDAVERLGNPHQPADGFRLEPYDKILVSHQTYSRLVAVNYISYIEACGDYTRIHTQDGFTGTLHHTIKRWMERLPESLFLQSHRSYIVNTDRIVRLDKKNRDSYEIVLDHPEARVPVSRGFSRKIEKSFRLR
jgi:two-component system LytT family response regulator